MRPLYHGGIGIAHQFRILSPWDAGVQPHPTCRQHSDPSPATVMSSGEESKDHDAENHLCFEFAVPVTTDDCRFIDNVEDVEEDWEQEASGVVFEETANDSDSEFAKLSFSDGELSWKMLDDNDEIDEWYLEEPYMEQMLENECRFH